jgi:hypothetical protein
MFQYAYARSLSIKNGKPFKYYFVHYRDDTKRQFELGVFNIKGERINGLLVEIIVRLSSFLGVNIPYFACGYWQSSKYFSDYEKEIREDFQFIKPLDRKNLSVLKKIEKTSSASIHIRRGDYVSNSKINKVHGTCSITYYRKAINHLKRKFPNSAFFVFSDDPNWVKENIKINNATYVDWNQGKNSYKDMQLMSRCKHNIIANSSFSWWGAWLNCNPKKIIIAPKIWFNDPIAQEKSKELIPKTWIRK